VVFVVYVGIGCGAGWGTTYDGLPAVLIGLENVAELGWHEPEELRKLLAHEIGHLVMSHLRGAEPASPGDPLCSLFSEGYAQHSEHLILGRQSWGCSSQDGWLEWCLAHEGDLARQFLRAADDRQATRRFFGSWFDVDGWRQTGYFLGCRLVANLAAERSMRELAVLTVEEMRAAARDYLESRQANGMGA
jgi:hypothetical protein